MQLETEYLVLLEEGGQLANLPNLNGVNLNGVNLNGVNLNGVNLNGVVSGLFQFGFKALSQSKANGK
ncbi:hypothetical protein ACOMHN_064564 [Nucella lapillus]